QGLQRFGRFHPDVELTLTCQPSPRLIEMTKAGRIDVALVTNCGATGSSNAVRHESLIWAGSPNFSFERNAPLPLALSPNPECQWRSVAVASLSALGRSYRIVLTSESGEVIAAAV